MEDLRAANSSSFEYNDQTNHGKIPWTLISLETFGGFSGNLCTLRRTTLRRLNTTCIGLEGRILVEVVYNQPNNSNATHSWIHSDIMIMYVDIGTSVNFLIINLDGNNIAFEIREEHSHLQTVNKTLLKVGINTRDCKYQTSLAIPVTPMDAELPSESNGNT